MMSEEEFVRLLRELELEARFLAACFEAALRKARVRSVLPPQETEGALAELRRVTDSFQALAELAEPFRRSSPSLRASPPATRLRRTSRSAASP
jgi:hypothetical protein